MDKEDVLQFLGLIIGLVFLGFVVLIPIILAFVAGVLYATNTSIWIVGFLVVLAGVIQLLKS